MLAIEQLKELETRHNKRILVFVNGSSEDHRVVDAAAKMAIDEGAEIVIMTVVPKVKRLPDEFIRFVHLERFPEPPHYIYYRYVAESILAPYLQRLESLGVPYEVRIEIGDRRERIEAVARALKPYRMVLSLKDWRDGIFSTLPFFGAFRSLNLGCPVTLIP